MLERITYPGGYMNRDQWESVRAGDWWCETCPSNGRGARKKGAYYWNSEVVGAGGARASSSLTSDSSMNMEPSNSPPRYVPASPSSETAAEPTMHEDVRRDWERIARKHLALWGPEANVDVNVRDLLALTLDARPASPVPAEAPSEDTALLDLLESIMPLEISDDEPNGACRLTIRDYSAGIIDTLVRATLREAIAAARSTPTEATNGE